MTASTAAPLLREDFQSELSALRSRYEDAAKRDDSFPNSLREPMADDVLEEAEVWATEEWLAVVVGFGTDSGFGSRLKFTGGAEVRAVWTSLLYCWMKNPC